MRRWLKITLASLGLLLLAVIPALLWLGTTESGLHWAYRQAVSYVPGTISIGKLEGRLFGTLTLDDVHYEFDNNKIAAKQISLEWSASSLLFARLNISHLHVQALKLTLPASAKTDQPLSLPDIDLPLQISLKDTVIDGFDIEQPDSRFELKQIRLSASTLLDQIKIKSLNVVAANYELNLKGKLTPTGNYKHTLEIEWQAKLPSMVAIKGKGSILGNIKTSKIQQKISGPMQLALNAELHNLSGKLDWQANAEISDFNAARLDASLPAITGKLHLKAHGDLATASMSGSMEGRYPEQGPFDTSFKIQRLANTHIQIDEFVLHAPEKQLRLNAHGDWSPADNTGRLALDWNNLRWPLQNTPWFNSASGNGEIEGNLDHYHFTLNTDRPWPQAPPSTWFASADGNLKGLKFQTLRVTALEGEAIATGNVSWSPRLTWKADIKASKLNPESLLPDWPGKLNAKLTSTGGIENGKLIADADITSVTGTLRKQPVSLHGQVGWRNDGLDIKQLNFSSGKSKLSATGRVATAMDLNWNIDSPDLADLYPQAKGQLQANGHLTGSPAEPVIDATLKGHDLSLPGYALGTIDGNIAVDLFHWQKINIRLAVEAAKIKNVDADSLSLTASNSGLYLKAVSGSKTIQIKLTGETDPAGWHGLIEQADFTNTHVAELKLKSPAKLAVTHNTLLLDPLCWQSQDGQACIHLQRKAGIWQAQLNMNQLPLMLISPWLPPDLKLEGVINATAELQYNVPGQLLGKAHITLPAGAVTYPLLEGERDRWEYSGGTMDLSLKPEGVQATTNLTLANNDHFQAQLLLPDANLTTLNSKTQTLKGSAKLEIHDLGLIEALVPELQDLKGTIKLALTAGGTLDQPRISGDVYLHDGSVRVPRLGLNIEQIKLDGHSDGFNKLSFNLDAKSGDGQLAIKGNTLLDKSKGWPTTIHIKGDNVEVSRIPEARINVTPDLQVELQHHTIKLTGSAHIPYAKLQPKDVTTAKRVSDDTIIVGGKQTDEEKWLIFTNVRLTLGERVNFYGFGFEGRLGGSILLKDVPGQVTTATGEINVPEGRYMAYGQRLEVEHGRLLYTGGPVANPGLDIRAVRHVSNITAGLKVRGSLSQPKVELFSIPAMGETDVLSYILFGRPAENASGEQGAMMAKAALALSLTSGDRLARILGDRFGLDEMRVESSDTGDQASLMIGRYLSPKLYVSYGIGLIGTTNSINLRYQISDKWQLKGVSGEHQGADLLYTIER
jgi:translocation and assembly module TamB